MKLQENTLRIAKDLVWFEITKILEEHNISDELYIRYTDEPENCTTEIEELLVNLSSHERSFLEGLERAFNAICKFG